MQGDRAALVDALREHLKSEAPLPEWLGVPVIDAVIWWAEHAPAKRRGRGARWKTAYRAALDRYAYASEVDLARAAGRTLANACALAAEWHHVDIETVRRAYREVRLRARSGVGLFLSRAARDYYERQRRMTPERSRQWQALLEKYPPRPGWRGPYDESTGPYPEFA